MAQGSDRAVEDAGDRGGWLAGDVDLERRQLMARNRARLIALGIPVAMMELRDLAVEEQPHPARARPHPRKPRQEPRPQQPTRRSTRLGAGAGEEEELLQLDGEGRATRQGAEGRAARRAHAAAEAEAEVEEELTEEERAARAAAARGREAAKLRQLELEGLVDLSDEAAVFVVIGSTGSHYRVSLSDAKRACNCMDCRCRHRDCKHIKLILRALQIEDDPKQWHQAVERCFRGAAAEGAPAAAEEAAVGPQAGAQGAAEGDGGGGGGEVRGEGGPAKKRRAARGGRQRGKAKTRRE